MKLTIMFEYEKETKGAVRYKEGGVDEPMIGTLYIRKSALRGSKPPKLITVTVEGE